MWDCIVLLRDEESRGLVCTLGADEQIRPTNLRDEVVTVFTDVSYAREAIAKSVDLERGRSETPRSREAMRGRYDILYLRV